MLSLTFNSFKNLPELTSTEHSVRSQSGAFLPAYNLPVAVKRFKTRYLQEVISGWGVRPLLTRCELSVRVSSFEDSVCPGLRNVLGAYG